jgi:hypothetical protein
MEDDRGGDDSETRSPSTAVTMDAGRTMSVLEAISRRRLLALAISGTAAVVAGSVAPPFVVAGSAATFRTGPELVFNSSFELTSGLNATAGWVLS